MYKILSILMLLLGAIFPSQVSAGVNIAVVAPLDGEYKIIGQELISGAKIAVDEINDNGGLLGKKVNLLVVDDQCNDWLAVSSAQMIAVNSSKKDKMNLVIGPYCQNALGDVAKTYNQAKIMQIIPTSVSEKEAVVNYNGLIKMVGYSEQQSLDFFKFYLKNFDNKRLALIYDSRDKEVVGVAAALQEQFNKSGKILNFKSFNFANYDGDYSQMAEDVVDGKSEVVVIFGTGEDVTKLAKSLKKEDKKLPLFVNRYQVQGRYLDYMGKLANGTYFLSLPTLKENTEFTETLVKMRLLGVEPKGLSVYSYSAVRLWADIVMQAESYQYDKMVNVLPEKVFDTTWGDVMFQEGNPVSKINYSIYHFDNGEYTQVY